MSVYLSYMGICLFTPMQACDKNVCPRQNMCPLWGVRQGGLGILAQLNWAA